MTGKGMVFARVVALPCAAVLLAAGFSPQSASGRSMAVHDQFVNVSVSFNTQTPLPDLGEAAVTERQERARRSIYRLASQECVLLKDTIARTCRLTNINVSTQIQQYDNQSPILYVNGSANFAVTLREDAVE